MNRRYESFSQLFSVEYLVDMMTHGKIRIPNYARRYVWSQDQALALFDSISRGYPIGTLLFSEGPAPDENVTFGPLTIAATADDRAYWVVDGQQRLVTLAAALTQSNKLDPRFNLAFDLRSERFVANPIRHSPSVVPLDVLYDDSKLRQWMRYEISDVDKMEILTEISWGIRRYQVAVNVIRNDNPGATLEIFERLNTSGVSLRQSELFSALATGASPSGRTRNLEDTAQLLADRTGFGIIDENTIMRSILSVESTDVTRISDISYGDLNSTYERGEEALIQAIQFMQEVADVPHVTFLSATYLIVVLTRFFSLHPDPDARNLRLLRRWFWRSSVLSMRPGYGRNLGALRAYLKTIHAGPTSQTLKWMLRDTVNLRREYPDVRKFQPRKPVTKVMLCSWWSLGPMDFVTGEPVLRSELSNILGSGSSPGRVTSLIVQENSGRALDSANRILLPTSSGASANLEEILHKPHRNIDDSTWAKILSSHLISTDDVLTLQLGAPESFWINRTDQIERQFSNFLDMCCEWDFEDTPSLRDLVIEEFEDE